MDERASMFQCRNDQAQLMRTPEHAGRTKSPNWVMCVALLALLMQVQGLVPLLFAGIAWLDGEHHVELDSAGSGFQLILKHDADAVPGSAFSCQHQHCTMDRLLVAFANPASSADPDHIFSFSNLDLADDSKHPQALSTSDPDGTCQPLIAFIAGGQATINLVSQRPHLTPFTRPPPSPAATAFIRQTVLTI